MNIIKLGALFTILMVIISSVNAIPPHARYPNNYYYQNRYYDDYYRDRPGNYYYSPYGYNPYGYGYNYNYGSLPPPSYNQSFPDDAAADALFWHSSQH